MVGVGLGAGFGSSRFRPDLRLEILSVRSALSALSFLSVSGGWTTARRVSGFISAFTAGGAGGAAIGGGGDTGGGVGFGAGIRDVIERIGERSSEDRSGGGLDRVLA